MAAEKKIYHYNPRTNEYIGSSIATRSPLEPGVWLIPAFATDVEPPKPKDGYAAVLTNGKWKQVQDHRGKIAYSKADGTPVQISDLGPVPAGYTLEPRPDVDHAWSGKGWKLDENRRRERLAAEARVKRDQLLAATDWIMLRAYESGSKPPAELKVYRQALRDITAQPGFPETIEWPVIPDNV